MEDLGGPVGSRLGRLAAQVQGEAVATDTADLEALFGAWRILGIIFAIELIWAVSYTVRPKPEPAPFARAEHASTL